MTPQQIRDINRKMENGTVFQIEHLFRKGVMVRITKVKTVKGHLKGYHYDACKWVSIGHAPLVEQECAPMNDLTPDETLAFCAAIRRERQQIADSRIRELDHEPI